MVYICTCEKDVVLHKFIWQEHGTQATVAVVT